MSVRIGSEKFGYLYCRVSDNPSEYAEFYDSYQECIADILELVEEDVARYNPDYTPAEIKKIKDYYENRFANSDCCWKNINK